MSIDEKGKEAVAGLRDSLAEYSDERKTFVNTPDLLEALEYITRLETQLRKFDTESGLKVGDKVEIIGRTTYEGRKGVITHIEPLAKNFPYSVTLFSEHGLAASIVYFGKHQVRKAP